MEPNQPKVPTKQPPHAALRGDAVASVAPTKINTMEVNNKAHKKGRALIKAIGILCHNFNTAGHLKHGQEWNGMQFFPPVIQNAIRKHDIEFPKYCSDNSRFVNDPVFGALAQASTASDYATVVATILCDKRFKMQDWISAPTGLKLFQRGTKSPNRFSYMKGTTPNSRGQFRNV